MLTWKTREWDISVGENKLDEYEMHGYTGGIWGNSEKDA